MHTLLGTAIVDAHKLEGKPLKELSAFYEPFLSEDPLSIVMIVEQY